MDFWEHLKNLFTASITLGRLDLPFNLLEFLFQFFLPTVLLLVFIKLINMGIRRVVRKSSLGESAGNRVRKWARIILRAGFLITDLILFSRLFGAEIGRFLNLLGSFLQAPILEAGGTKITFITILMTIPVFYLATWAGSLTKAFMNQSVLKNLGLDESKKFSISTLSRYLVIVIILLVGLSIIGIDLSSLTVLFGVLGIGLGFGLQNTVANFFAGVTILFSQPVREGDRILVGGVEGTVLHIRILSTVIGTLTHEVIIIPNSRLVGDAIHNYSYNDRHLIIHNDVQVSYEADVDKALAILKGIGEDSPYRFSQEAVETRVVSFDDSGISLKLLTWISDVNSKYEAVSWNNREIWSRFKAEGVVIPFPQMDLHVIPPREEPRS